VTERPRLLIIDDELGPRESLRVLLKRDYDVQTAEGGLAALTLLPAFKPDLVLLDLKMPEMDGLEVLRRIKRLDPSIEVILITAYATAVTANLALSGGAAEVLIKPCPRQDLEAAVRRAIGRRHGVATK
jgi:DNA-binding NtrC family response regulator